MKEFILGKTGIKTVQNAFGALPIQRVEEAEAVKILRRALEGGITYFDTARAYSNSEEKLRKAFSEAGLRDKVFIATKTMARDPEGVRRDLDTSLKTLGTDHIDVYQFHMVDRCYAPGDGTGMYECMEEAKKQGKIGHIGITAHKLGVAEEIAKSGLYETLQFPFSYLATEREIKLLRTCEENNVGFIAMKGLAGGLINRSKAAMAFMVHIGNVLPIWGIQRMSELEEWLSYMDKSPEYDGEIREFIEKEKATLAGDFCRGCGYCMPCPAGIQINNCARMSLMLRRAPSAGWLSEKWQAEMEKIEGCLECRQCTAKCPYELDTPTLLKKNLEDYRKVLAGEVSVS
ncbi:MAG: aldo/keto reductase [Lachnospiraceae bacterium]|nr:aldo/keto reductase [Lachnospiraceae bacterium]